MWLSPYSLIVWLNPQIVWAFYFVVVVVIVVVVVFLMVISTGDVKFVDEGLCKSMCS